MSGSTYKGKNVFVTNAGSEYVSLGGRDAEMTFGIGTISYTELHDGNNNGDTDLAHKPSAVFTAASALATLEKNTTYEITDLGGKTAGDTDPAAVIAGSTLTSSTFAVGTTFKVGTADIGSLSDTKYKFSTNALTEDIEAVQAKINTARVQAGSQYAALESAVSFTTDLTAQYELGFNTVNDVNFSMETAHLAKNQILQQAATAMLAQANQGQQGLLQLIQG